MVKALCCLVHTQFPGMLRPHGYGTNDCACTHINFPSFSDLAIVTHSITCMEPFMFGIEFIHISFLSLQHIIQVQILLYDIVSQEIPSSLHTHTLLIASTSTISCPELRDLVLLPVIHWFELGLWLNIPEGDLSIIEADNPINTEACKRKMFSSWLKNNPEASYRQLVDALHTVGSHRMADQLCTKYGIV